MRNSILDPVTLLCNMKIQVERFESKNLDFVTEHLVS
jgi:hypothetical protein